MKKIISTLCFLPTLFWSQTQMNYTVERDAPEEIPWISTNLDLFSLDVPVSNIDATCFYLGLWGYIKPVEKLPLFIDYNIKRSYFVLGTIGNKEFPKTWIVNAGGRFNLFGRTKTRKTKVVLDSKKDYVDTRTTKNKEVTRTTYLTIPAKRRFVTAARGGLYLKRRGYSNSDIESLNFASRLSTTGFYAGIMMSSYKNVVIKTKQYGTSAGSKGLDFYADVVVAGNKFTRISDGVDITEIAKNDLDQRTPLGLRIGLQTYEIEKKLYTDKMFGMNYNFEVGILSYEGIYFQGGVTLTLIKIKK